MLEMVVFVVVRLKSDSADARALPFPQFRASAVGELHRPASAALTSIHQASTTFIHLPKALPLASMARPPIHSAIRAGIHHQKRG